MKKIVEEVLEELTQKKQEAMIFPTYVIDVELKKEIWKRINLAIRDLKKEKKVKVGNTFNHKFVELIDTKK